MSDEPTPEPAPFKAGDKVTITAEVTNSNGKNWVVKLPSGSHCVLTSEQMTKQP